MALKRGGGRRTRASKKPELLPDLGTAWMDAGRASCEIIFDHFALHMLARAGAGDYTSSRGLILEQSFMVTLELDEERFQQLLRLLPPDGALQVAEALGGPFVDPQILNIPPGAIVVGLRTRLGPARTTNADESYVPLIVTAVFPPGPLMSITFEEVMSSGVLEVLETTSGSAHGVCSKEIHNGDRIDVWLRAENNWVSGTYQRATTSDGAFEPKFALLLTERTGGRPIFLGYKVRRAAR
jgi:hypothetical protein